jgi:AmmeMemoRadiSam system protein B
LDFLPSPVADRPGLMVRDPYGYSEATLIVPPALVQALQCFDGAQTESDLREVLTKISGEFQVAELVRHLHSTLDDAGFLVTEHFEEMRAESHRKFAEAPARMPAHSGSAYPDEKDELQELFADYLAKPENGCAAAANLLGIAAPHVSPEGGWESYREAFCALPCDLSEKVFVVLGTSHYGEPGRFGLTRKNYVTPFGAARTETAWVDWLERRAPAAIEMEDYCHSVEHSIEFQIVFLQSIFGPDIRVLPVLCGSFGMTMGHHEKPESDDAIHAFLDSFAELAEREKGRACFVLGVDMAHIGRRYGDSLTARAGTGHMTDVALRDRARIGRLCDGDTDGFWDLVRQNGDDLRWCGSAPLYTFLRAARPTSGALRRYQQWNIDEQSVVSFAAMSFER